VAGRQSLGGLCEIVGSVIVAVILLSHKCLHLPRICLAVSTMKHEDNNLVRLAAFEHEYEAVLLKNSLVDNGIEAWVTGGDGVNTFGAGLTAAGLVAVDVRIRQKDLANAQSLLNQIEKDIHALPTPSWTCKCGEDVDEGFAICWSCGADFDERNKDV
jgi:hypothetical protein